MTGTEDEFRKLLHGVAARNVPERERLAGVRARRRRLRVRRTVTSSLAAAALAGSAGVGYAVTRDARDDRASLSAATTSRTAATATTAAPDASTLLCPPGQAPSETVTRLKTAGGHSTPEDAVRAAGPTGTLRRTGSADGVVTLTESDTAGKVVAAYDVAEVRAGSWGISTVRVPGPCVASGTDGK